MSRPVIFAILAAALAFLSPVRAQQPTPEQKLATAKADFDKNNTALKQSLVASLKTKSDTAQKAGDLKTLEKVAAELKAFETSGALPSTVSTMPYFLDSRKAKAKLEEAYAACVKQLTIDGKIDAAKAVQAELEEFKKLTAEVKPVIPAALAKGSVLIGTMTNDKNKEQQTPVKFEITSMNASKFEANFGPTNAKPNLTVKVAGTYKAGVISWQMIDRRDVYGGSACVLAYTGSFKEGYIQAKATSADKPHTLLLRLDVPEEKPKDPAPKDPAPKAKTEAPTGPSSVAKDDVYIGTFSVEGSTTVSPVSMKITKVTDKGFEATIINDKNKPETEVLVLGTTMGEDITWQFLKKGSASVLYARTFTGTIKDGLISVTSKAGTKEYAGTLRLESTAKETKEKK